MRALDADARTPLRWHAYGRGRVLMARTRDDLRALVRSIEGH